MTEAIRQLTGGPAAQVTDAQLGLVSGFGMVTYDRACAPARSSSRDAAP